MISIIIPTLNEEKYLPRLLTSISKQDFNNYEVIVSDAGSSDKTLLLAHDFKARTISDGSIKHPSAQRNNGAKLAKGEILLFLDADSELPANFLAHAHKEFLNRKIKVAGFYIKFNPSKIKYLVYSITSNLLCGLKQYTRHPAAIGAGLMIERDLHERIEGFDLSVVLAEDYDYCARAATRGKFRMIKGVRLLYSSRRLQKDGFWRTGWKWLRMGMFTIFNRRIEKTSIKYDFGKF